MAQGVGIGLLILLAVDIVFYARTDPLSALDGSAWLGLLLLIDSETRSGLTPFRRALLHAIRFGLILLIVAIFLRHTLHEDWLDVVNTGLWFAVILVMEWELRHPRRPDSPGWAGVLHRGVLLPGLVGVAGLWVWQGHWLDGWDAILWILAYVIIERDIGLQYRGSR